MNDISNNINKYKIINYTCLIILNIIKRYNIYYELLECEYSMNNICDTIIIYDEDKDGRETRIIICTNPFITCNNICILYINDIKFEFQNPENFHRDIKELLSFLKYD